MKVTVSCAERFHSYNLAAQFSRVDYLDKLITTYPKSEVMKYGIPYDKIRSLLAWEIIKRGWAKWSNWTGADFNRLISSINEVYDWTASQYLDQQDDFFIGWSGRSERQIIKAKSYDITTIVERGSSHITYQTELLVEEYKKFYPSYKKIITPNKVIEKELREYELADYISVPSSFVKRSFLAKGIPESKIIQNAYGVNTDEFIPGRKMDDTFRVIYVGQMSLRKGVHYLLEAFSQLTIQNAELLLIGGKLPEMDPFLAKYQKNVRYLGSKPQSLLQSYYQQASVFAICSIEEGMAMVQAQAAACGLPIICTTNSGGEDLIENGVHGFVLPIREVDVLREKLEWIYVNREAAQEMGSMARQHVLNGFTWKDYGDRYVKQLQAIKRYKEVQYKYQS